MKLVPKDIKTIGLWFSIMLNNEKKEPPCPEMFVYNYENQKLYKAKNNAMQKSNDD